MRVKAVVVICLVRERSMRESRKIMVRIGIVRVYVMREEVTRRM